MDKQKAQQGAILVVDDNEHNRDLLSRRLQRRGHTTVAAEDGVRCLEMLVQQSFDLVLLDIMMPRLGGFGVLERMKADAALRHIPVIVVSALDEIDSVVRCIEMGAEDYLTKPFNGVLLRAKVEACLERKYLRDQEQAHLRSMKQELELARRTQADFLPAELPRIPGWEIGAAFYPAREVAGDFYDAFMLTNNCLALIIADVCDKGVGAALFMALTRSLMRAFAEQGVAASTSALTAVELTNSYIVRHHRQTHMFATLFFGMLDVTSGELHYINAGHPAPVLLHPSGTQTLLEFSGPAVGLMLESTFSVGQIHFGPGDTFLAYTDGAIESRDAAGTLFGEDRLLALLDDPTIPLTAMMAQIEHATRQHQGHAVFADDITLLALRRTAREDGC